MANHDRLRPADAGHALSLALIACLVPFSALVHWQRSISEAVTPRPARTLHATAELTVCRGIPREMERYGTLVQFQYMGMTLSVDGKGNMVGSWAGRDCSVLVTYTMMPVFADDESDISALPARGRFELIQRQGPKEFRYQVTEKSGSLSRRYTVNGKKRDMNAEFVGWRREMITEFFRRTGYNADLRVKKIRARSGLDGALREVGAIENLVVRGMYVAALMADPATTPQEGLRILQAAGVSPGTTVQVAALGAAPLRLFADPAFDQAHQKGFSALDGDADKGGVLARLMEQHPRGAMLERILTAAEGIDADGDRVAILRTVLEDARSLEAVPPQFYRVARGIRADQELRDLLVPAFQGKRLRDSTCRQALDLVKSMRDDGSRSAVIVAASGALRDNGVCALGALEHTRGILADGERGQVLRSFLEQHVLDEKLLEPFFAATNEIGSDEERSQVLAVVMDQRPIQEKVIVKVLASAKGMASSGERSKLLVKAAERAVIITPGLRESYLEIAKSLEGEDDREAALRALGGRGQK